MAKKYDFINKIVKQGNSLCVRIPNNIVKAGRLIEGMEANIIISSPEEMYKYDEKNIKTLLKIANQIRELDKYAELKKRFFIMLNFDFLKQTTTPNEKETERKQRNFIKQKEKEYDSKLIKEFIDFSMILNKEAFTMEDSVAILKSKYKNYLSR